MREYKEYHPNSASATMQPLGDRARTRTRCPIGNIRVDVRVRALRALIRAERHYAAALALVNSTPPPRKLAERFEALRHHIERGDLHLRTARATARACDLPDVLQLADVLNSRAAPLRPSGDGTP